MSMNYGSGSCHRRFRAGLHIFLISYFLLSIGIALENRCQLPIIPTDLFPRELSSIIKKPYARVKITFDVLCLATTGLLTGLMLGYLDGLGIGTIVAAFTMGKWFRSQAAGSIRELLLYRP